MIAFIIWGKNLGHPLRFHSFLRDAFVISITGVLKALKVVP